MIQCLGSVFFLQAEDGIRDVAVTGVQTCALPICQFFPSTVGGCAFLPTRSVGEGGSVPADGLLCPSSRRLSNHGSRRCRSEERRVGKEGRSRWWPEH